MISFHAMKCMAGHEVRLFSIYDRRVRKYRISSIRKKKVVEKYSFSRIKMGFL
jgi:hypothetical protein